jgi:hypothetical protein
MTTPHDIKTRCKRLQSAYLELAAAQEQMAAIKTHLPGEHGYRKGLARTARANAASTIETDLPMLLAHRVIEK